MTILATLGAFALLLFLLAAAGQLDQSRVLAQWEMRLNPESLRVYSEVADEIQWKRGMMDASYEDAARAHQQNSRADALHFLDLAARIVAECSPSFVSLVVNTGRLARYADAIAPMPPLDPHAMKLRRACILAGFHVVAQQAIPTTRDRLRFRLVVLRGAFATVSHALLRATRLTRAEPEDARRWARHEAARADLGTLTDESLETLRTVLASLAAVRRPAPAKETA